MITATTNQNMQGISLVDAIWSIIQSQPKVIRDAIFLKVEEEQKHSKSSNDIMKQLNALEEGPDGFLKLDDILPPSKMSVDELREDAYIEKYGI